MLSGGSPKRNGLIDSPTKTGLLDPLPNESPSGWAAKEGAVPVYDEGTNLDPFSSFPDYSKINTGRHSASRCDTFSTPTRLGKREPTITPTKMDMKTCDLLWLCEQCFRKEVGGLGNQILKAVRGEFQEAMGTLHQQVTEIVDTKMTTIIAKTHKIQTEVEAPVKIDLQPVHVQVDSHRDETRRLETRLTMNISQVFDELSTVREQAKESENHLRTEVKELHDEISKTMQKQIEQILETQESIREQLSKSFSDIQKMQLDSHQLASDFAPQVEAHFAKHFNEQTVNVDFSQVLRMLGNAQESANCDFHRVFSELKTLENTVGNSLVGMLDPQFQSIERKLQEIREVEEAAMEFHSRVTEDNGVQTDAVSRNDMWAQTDEPPKKVKRHPNSKKEASQVVVHEPLRKRGDTDSKQVGGFADAEAMKAKVRAALIKPQYNVMDFYKTRGPVQKIARSWVFENLTFLVIFLNAIWIAVDTDNNDAAMLIDAHAVFQVVENLFCFYFTFELIIRFSAFRRKANAFKDPWFVFDLLLVTLMVLETWVVTLIMLFVGSAGSAKVGDASILRMVRMVKMIRLSRMARLLRAIPELMILLKCIGAATRIFLVFFLSWLLAIYVFAVLFRQVSDGQAIGDLYFGSVPNAMNTLLLDGLLPDNSVIMNRVGAANPPLYPVMLMFILMCAVTLLYMLIGVLVNVIGVVANAEKEAMLVQNLASMLRTSFQDLQYPTDANLSREEFEKLLVEPDIIGILQDSGVDVVVLVDMSSLIFEDSQQEGGMNFEYMVEMALKMRGTNPATVKDVKQQLRVIQLLVKESVDYMLTHITTELSKVHTSIHALHDSSSGGSETAVGADEVLPIE